MPKINGKNIDPKVYAKRVTQAKKAIAAMDPAVKQRLKEMYPSVNVKKIIGEGLTRKATNAVKAKKNSILQPNAKKASPKPTAKPVVKKATPTKNSILQPNAKPKGLNDFLKEGKRPPSKNKKIPSDADVIIKGYNDKKTLSKNKKK
jgi:hypothetical protein